MPTSSSGFRTSSSTRPIPSLRCSRACRRPAPTWCSACSTAARDEPGDVIQTDGDGRVTGLETKEERPLRPDRYVCWMFAVWRHTFTRFMTGALPRARRAGGGSMMRRSPGAKAPEWPVGAVIAAAMRERPARRQCLLRVGPLPRCRHARRHHCCGALSDRLERRRSRCRHEASSTAAAIAVPAAVLAAAVRGRRRPPPGSRSTRSPAAHGTPAFEPHVTLHVAELSCGSRHRGVLAGSPRRSRACAG